MVRHLKNHELTASLADFWAPAICSLLVKILPEQLKSQRSPPRDGKRPENIGVFVPRHRSNSFGELILMKRFCKWLHLRWLLQRGLINAHRINDSARQLAPRRVFCSKTEFVSNLDIPNQCSQAIPNPKWKFHTFLRLNQKIFSG